MDKNPPSSAPEAPQSPGRPPLDWLRLFLEFVIVVAGISLSFWLQDLRQLQGDRAEERRYLEGLKRDLAMDEVALSKTAEMFGRMVESIDALLDPESRAEMSIEEIDVAMDALLTYAGFSSVQATYKELQQSGGSKLIQDKELLAEVISLYDRMYSNAEEWEQINRSYVLDQMFPYLAEFGPVIEEESTGTFVGGLNVAFTALQSEAHFQNLIRMNRTFKSAQKTVFEGVAAEVQRVLALFPELETVD